MTATAKYILVTNFAFFAAGVVGTESAQKHLVEKIQQDLPKLCNEIGNRHLGSPGNRYAATFFTRQIN